MQFKSIEQCDLKDKVVFVRSDMNVPIVAGQITDNTRIIASLATIKYILSNGGKVVLATHLGRPTEGEYDQSLSVLPIALAIEKELGMKVSVQQSLDQMPDFSQSKIVMLENVRMNKGEKANAPELGQKYAKLCDIFVYDAFATAHRKEASTNAIAEFTRNAYAGILMAQELDALNNISQNSKHPIVAIVGGSKVSTKLKILENLINQVDCLIVGGGILNTFLVASGYNVGASLYEKDLVESARTILSLAKQKNVAIPLPSDVVVATKFAKNASAATKAIDLVTADEMILDVGVNFMGKLDPIIANAKTIIWNGPLGVFEFDQFANGTKLLANAIAKSSAFSLAGGGDTISAINKFGLFDQISYVSTAGGALLEFLEGAQLPAIEMLKLYFKA